MDVEFVYILYIFFVTFKVERRHRKLFNKHNEPQKLPVLKQQQQKNVANVLW